MQKYTANYAYTNPNFVIQNLDYNAAPNEHLKPLLYVLKNILQRGFPTVMSKFLQDKIGKIHETDTFAERLLLVSPKLPSWQNTIKGGENSNQALTFFEKILPEALPQYAFIQSMLIPEMPINDITDETHPKFVRQQVDFHLPQARLVIEIDGPQHQADAQKMLDNERDNYLTKNGILTVRITTKDIDNQAISEPISQIEQRLKQSEYAGLLNYYKMAFEKARKGFSQQEITQKMLPTAVIRFEILLIDLLLHQHLRLGEHWRFNIQCEEPLEPFAQLAIDDVYLWLKNLYALREKEEMQPFDYEINLTAQPLEPRDDAINIDFSLLKRYSDEAQRHPNVIFVRSDYFDFSQKRNKKGLDKNYFHAHTAPSINYRITDNDKATLRFFLQNLFNKNDFRNGQFAIVANALNLQDTVGLLPTGGGKSLCYQLPCMLQPAINFVVCPIKSLMYDQADNLRRNDVAITNVNFLNSEQKGEERTQIMQNFVQGKFLFIWISPERFQIKSFRDSFRACTDKLHIAYAVIDEVHCMSEWGHDFRTSYLHLTKTIEAISPRDAHNESTIKFLGLTATASVNVLNDIRIEFSRNKQTLDDNNIKTLIDYTRPELRFEVLNDNNNKDAALESIFQKYNIPHDKTKATLIFTPHVNGKRGCYPLAQRLNERFPGKVAWYAGGCPKINGQNVMELQAFDEYKRAVQDDFKQDKYQILCATKAFGMGIDKQNIFYTVHYGIPNSVEALYQEAGRAGRWDKNLPENKMKKGRCFVLFSNEIPQYQEDINKLFQENISIEEMNLLLNKLKWNAQDIATQLFFFINHLQDVQNEYEEIMKIIKHFYKEKQEVTISLQQVADLQIDTSTFEREIYRLGLLGIVSDWTVDFNAHTLDVRFESLNDEHIIASLQKYISKYAPDEPVEKKIRAVSQPKCITIAQKATWYLLEWIFTHITKNRKQSLKTLVEWCVDFQDSDAFKKRLDSYFTFNDSTFLLQHIAEHSQEFDKWFKVFYINELFLSRTELEQLRDRLSRFLESYHNSPGLDFISGMVRFLLGDFENADGRHRLVKALHAVRNAHDNHLFHENICQFLQDAHFDESLMTKLCEIIIEQMPEMNELFIDKLGMIWLANDDILLKINVLHNINCKLYEHLGRI